ncbi:c2H2-type domain-containing protein [Nephila pilipes]|uniref:C2H2-type domain-containing protein n=1 Tax=Nephila pilipes TaxID=299642 RepID=A0A8X6TJY9_NEPPI|nr:c2H2-type domain-containing protein [Nephila pilipes]
MAGVHEKTCKWFNEHLKRGKCKINKSDLIKEGITEKINHCNLTANMCPYCSKIFINTKYLLNHIFRKHSDTLVNLHGNVMDLIKAEKANRKSPDLLNYMRTEFSHLKGDVEMIKKVLVDHLEGKNDEQLDIKNTCEATLCRSSNVVDADSRIKTAELSKSDPEVNADQITLTDFQQLKAQISELFQIIQETVASKDVEKSASLIEERIYKNLKRELLTEYQDMFMNHQKDNRAECEKYFSEIKKDIFKLEKAIELNSKKIDSSEYLQGIQNKFEYQVQNLLSSHSMLNLNIKEDKTSRSKKTDSEHKQSLNQRLNRRKKSIYISNSLYVRNNKVSPVNKNEDRHSSFDYKRTKSSEPANEFNYLVNGFEKCSDMHVSEAKLMLEEKLKTLNVNPYEDKLSYEEFEKKMRLVNSERDILDKKYVTFSKTRDRIDSYVNKFVKSKMSEKHPKKICLSYSPDVCSQAVSDHDFCFREIYPVNKKGSPGFILSSEQHEVHEKASGILVRNSNGKNVSQIQENVETAMNDPSHSFPPTSSLVKSPNDHTFIKEFSPINWPNYSTANSNISKKSNYGVSQKSIEEISDLSSLESDTLED